MNFESKLIKSSVERRYKQLIVDVKLKDGSVVQALCTDTTNFKNFYAKDTEIWISKVNDERRLVNYECQLLNRGDGLVLINPKYNNDLFAEAFNNGILQDFNKYTNIRAIEHDDKLRHFDFELYNEYTEKCYVHVVKVIYKEGAYAIFPTFLDFFEMEVFEAATKLRANGNKTVLFIIVPRMDCLEAKFSWNINPISAAKVFDEAKNGLDFLCYSCNINQKSVTIAHKMKINY